MLSCVFVSVFVVVLTNTCCCCRRWIKTHTHTRKGSTMKFLNAATAGRLANGFNSASFHLSMISLYLLGCVFYRFLSFSSPSTSPRRTVPVVALLAACDYVPMQAKLLLSSFVFGVVNSTSMKVRKRSGKYNKQQQIIHTHNNTHTHTHTHTHARTHTHTHTHVLGMGVFWRVRTSCIR